MNPTKTATPLLWPPLADTKNDVEMLLAIKIGDIHVFMPDHDPADRLRHARVLCPALRAKRHENRWCHEAGCERLAPLGFLFCDIHANTP